MRETQNLGNSKFLKPPSSSHEGHEPHVDLAASPMVKMTKKYKYIMSMCNNHFVSNSLYSRRKLSYSYILYIFQADLRSTQGLAAEDITPAKVVENSDKGKPTSKAITASSLQCFEAGLDPLDHGNSDYSLLPRFRRRQ